MQLSQELASEAQVSEILAGDFSVIAEGEQIRDVTRLISEYGGDASDWAKITSSSFTAANGATQQTHAYYDILNGLVYELKTVFGIANE